jgi:outer membrane protein TolC
LQVRQAWLNCQETKKRITVTQQSITQADENLKVTADRYQQGLSTNTDVLRAEDLRIMAHNNFNNANFDSALAILQLRRSVGIL